MAVRFKIYRIIDFGKNRKAVCNFLLGLVVKAKNRNFPYLTRRHLWYFLVNIWMEITLFRAFYFSLFYFCYVYSRCDLSNGILYECMDTDIDLTEYSLGRTIC